MSEDITRRKLMRVGAGATALGAVGSLSGCSAIQDLIPGGGGAGISSYSNWVYEPDTFESDAEGINVFAFSTKKALSNSGNLNEDFLLSLKSNSSRQLGIRAENINMGMSVPDGSIVTGSFDTESIKAELESSRETPTESGFGSNDDSTAGYEYESETTHEGYEIYVRADQEEPGRAYAIGDGTIVQGNRVSNDGNESDSVSAEDVAKGIIDTGESGDNRLVDNNEEFKTLVDSTDKGVSISLDLYDDEVGSEDGPDEDVRSREFDGLIGYGQADTFNGDTTKIQYVFVFGSEGDVNEGDIEEWVEANDTGEGNLSELRDIKINTDGNTATVTGKIDTIEYDFSY
ncbi:hypothetical protein EGH22_02250 [Halomicroarcula sp. F28]|uniref:hypothetical protein n=1 Tax=Haloarcula salinisoli TaxID=2487746 RepID=UPI001C7358FA|nr:hypothetical protein [Halomicroarcula salinisoli]MBX0285137.1 hypothetical protein [Halomicroarcula salinisoli]